MWKKSIIALGALFLVLCVYMAFSIFQSTSSQQQDEITIISDESKKLDTKETSEESGDSDESLDEKDNQYQGSSRAYYITDEDCDNACKNFDENSSGWRYCANICGIIPVKEVSGDCTDKTGLSQDYCYRDIAVTAKDTKKCDAINDRGILEQCRQRITEILIDEL